MVGRFGDQTRNRYASAPTSPGLTAARSYSTSCMRAPVSGARCPSHLADVRRQIVCEPTITCSEDLLGCRRVLDKAHPITERRACDDLVTNSEALGPAEVHCLLVTVKIPLPFHLLLGACDSTRFGSLRSATWKHSGSDVKHSRGRTLRAPSPDPLLGMEDGAVFPYFHAQKRLHPLSVDRAGRMKRAEVRCLQ